MFVPHALPQVPLREMEAFTSVNASEILEEVKGMVKTDRVREEHEYSSHVQREGERDKDRQTDDGAETRRDKERENEKDRQTEPSLKCTPI